MKALITLLVLGSSSVALAQPIVRDHRTEPQSKVTLIRDHRLPVFTVDATVTTTQAPVVRDHRTEPTFMPPVPHQHDDDCDHDDDDYDDDDYDDYYRPVTLAQNATFSYDRPLWIGMDRRSGGFSKLRLDRELGRTYIERVVVYYPNGRTRTIMINQALSARTPSLFIHLDRRAITGVYIYGDARRSRASFDVIGLRR